MTEGPCLARRVVLCYAALMRTQQARLSQNKTLSQCRIDDSNSYILDIYLSRLVAGSV